MRLLALFLLCPALLCSENLPVDRLIAMARGRGVGQEAALNDTCQEFTPDPGEATLPLWRVVTWNRK